MILKIKKNKVDFIIVLLSILLSKSLYYESFGENYLLIYFLFFLILIFFIRKFKRIQFIKLFFLIFFFILIFINPGSNFRTSSVFILSMINAILISELISFKFYSNKFYLIIKFLVILSFLRYLIIIFNIYSPLINFESIIGDPFSNFIFFGIPQTSAFSPLTFIQLLRNNGLWYEPGAFQIFINLAFIFGIINNKVSFKTYLLFLICIISTLSTIGIFVFLFLSIYYFNFSIIRLTVVSSLSAILILILPFDFIDIVFSKLNFDNPSTLSRTRDFELYFNLFISNPILGAGFGDSPLFNDLLKSSTFGTGSNSFFALLSYTGITSLSLIFPLIYPYYIIKFSLIRRFLLSLCFFSLFFTQNFLIIQIFTVLIMYGVDRKNINIF